MFRRRSTAQLVKFLRARLVAARQGDSAPPPPVPRIPWPRRRQTRSIPPPPVPPQRPPEPRPSEVPPSEAPPPQREG